MALIQSQNVLNKAIAAVATALRAVFTECESNASAPATGPHTGRIRPAANRWLQHFLICSKPILWGVYRQVRLTALIHFGAHLFNRAR